MIESKKGLNLVNVIRKLDNLPIKIRILILIYDKTSNKEVDYYTVWNSEELIRELKCDRRTIFKALKELEENKIIEIKRIKGKYTKLIKIIE